MSESENEYLSIVGFSLLQPLLSLIQDLGRRKTQPPNDVQTSPLENGDACGISVLSVVLLESCMARTQAVIGESIRKETLETTLNRIIKNGEIASSISDCIAVRDAIVHAHLWSGTIDPMTMTWTKGPTIRQGYGNRRFMAVLDPTTRTTRHLGLNLVPTRVWRRDAFIVFTEVCRALLAVEQVKKEYFPISNSYFPFEGKMQKLATILQGLAIPDST